ncbi:hypothetical protein PHYSODRAFT_253536 [Phytophthora sojae]|uniref:Retrotransposon gag domain-containing protein n=1 Tax=Phytophthora sojae (strain P6497) TaxID=1094619 RepID=G4YSY4_PHYSP|nr:hypothetical protein PHYSODRAFT_253536 [Phytophthora sojae]EGZ25403.1 hypothetical protein PHYSODRAFT_253536 [Phytophthora sojae]|eukprot:XP_009520691.1 hypothetical protein PHYSODRAFT_253536 [Phytophthora sojae]
MAPGTTWQASEDGQDTDKFAKRGRGDEGDDQHAAFNRVGDRDHGSGADDDGSEDEVGMKGPAPMLEDEAVDELTVVVGKSGAPRPIDRRLDAELGEVTPAKVLVPDERQTMGRQPPASGDTSNAYKILGQVGRSMVATSAWVIMFAPKEVRGTKWVTLERDLASPIDGSSLFQLSEQTKRLLVAMGFECTSLPTMVVLEIWELAEVSAELTKWKRKLKNSFGVRGMIKTPDSPNIGDSHMMTPKKNSEGRLFNPPALAGDDDDDDDDTGHGFVGPCEDLMAQIRQFYQRKDEDGAQRVKLMHHISLNKLTKFSRTRSRSERSLRWLKNFIYEMEKNTHPQDRWCDPFQLLMESGASNRVRQISKKTRNKWSLLCEAFMAYYCSKHDKSADDRYCTATRDEGEHICDYLLRLKGYDHSAKIAYKAGGTVGARHVKRFLDTCNDDALARQLIPQRFDNIAKVEAVM